MKSDCSFLKRSALGALGGVAGTVALHGLMRAATRLRPRSKTPMRIHPGRHFYQKAESRLHPAVRKRIPDAAEQLAAHSLSFGYGMSLGALYGAMRPRGGNVVAEGLALGMGCWAAGYLGWLPAMKLMPPIWEHNAEQIAAPIIEHAAYGVVTVGAYNALLGKAS